MAEGIRIDAVLDTIVTHSWILNPYSYLGDSLSAILYSWTTYGLLIVVWWLCFTCLHLLGTIPKPALERIMEGLCLAIGLAAMTAMQWAGFVMYLWAIRLDDYKGVNAVFAGKIVMSLVSIGLGVALFTLLGRIRNRWTEAPRSPATTGV